MEGKYEKEHMFALDVFHLQYNQKKLESYHKFTPQTYQDFVWNVYALAEHLESVLEKHTTQIITNLRTGFYYGSLLYAILDHPPKYTYIKSCKSCYYNINSKENKKFKRPLIESINKLYDAVKQNDLVVFIDSSARAIAPNSIHTTLEIIRVLSNNHSCGMKEIMRRYLHISFEPLNYTIDYSFISIENIHKIKDIHPNEDEKHIIFLYSKNKRIGECIDDVRPKLIWHFKYGLIPYFRGIEKILDV